MQFWLLSFPFFERENKVKVIWSDNKIYVTLIYAVVMGRIGLSGVKSESESVSLFIFFGLSHES